MAHRRSPLKGLLFPVATPRQPQDNANQVLPSPWRSAWAGHRRDRQARLTRRYASDQSACTGGFRLRGMSVLAALDSSA